MQLAVNKMEAVEDVVVPVRYHNRGMFIAPPYTSRSSVHYSLLEGMAGAE